MPQCHTGKVPRASKRGAGKLSPLRLATMERRAAATRLRAAGRTFKQIGEALGVTTGRAYQLVDEALYATVAAPAESLRQIEIARLDQLLTGVYSKALRGDHAAIGSVLRIMARIERLTGMDSPLSVPSPSSPDDSPSEGALTLRFIDGTTGKEIKDFGPNSTGNKPYPRL
jgi:hypothetical protein